MKVYGILSKVPFLKRYSFKFLFVAFLGIHIPLLSVIGFILIDQSDGNIPALRIFLLVLAFTLIATVITLLTLNSLLAPLITTKKSLESYVNEGVKPEIPTTYSDEAGILMRDVQNTIIKVENMLETQRDLTSLLSHDLRTPLAEMVGVAQVIDPGDPKETETMAKHIINSGNNLLNVLQSILTMMKLDNLEINREDKVKIELRDYIDELKGSLLTTLDRKHIELVNQVPDEIQLSVHEFTFEHALTNLITNAVKFSNPEQKILISATMNNGLVTITIKDEGIGLEPGMENLIFERFTKYGRQGTNKEKSTGLGLYLTRKIIELHQGTVYAESEGKDKGSIFTIKLPV